MNVNETLELRKALLQEKEETEPLTYEEYMLLGDLQYLTYEIYAASTTASNCSITKKGSNMLPFTVFNL